MKKVSLGSVKGWVYKLVAIVLWAATAALGLVEVYLLRQTAIGIYLRFDDYYPTAQLIGTIVPFVFGIVWMVFAIGSAEYHIKNVGKQGSWTLFAWSVAIELLILILYFIV